jgi:lipoprotein-releasing system permease protein
MLWGNVVGLSLCMLQKHFHLLALNPEVYYIPYVPIELNLWHMLLLNIGTLVVSMLMLLGPSYIVALIRPAQSIKFE